MTRENGGRLVGKVAVVTGGGSGIGAAMAQALHAEGAYVAVADISGKENDVAATLATARSRFLPTSPMTPRSLTSSAVPSLSSAV